MVMTLSFWLLYYRPDLRRALIFQSFTVLRKISVSINISPKHEGLLADQWSNRLFFQGWTSGEWLI